MSLTSVTRGFAVLFLTVPLLLHLSIGHSSGEDACDPAVRTQLSLDPAGPPDSDPAFFNCMIPWESGEPSITRVSIRTCSQNWTDLEEWTIVHNASSKRSMITISIDMEWGCEEEILVSITDGLGSNSTVGTIFVSSRRPSVQIRHILEDEKGPTEGWNKFLMIAEDPDGQELEQVWYVDGQAVLSGEGLEVYLPEGGHVVCAEVTDGQWTVQDEMNVVVLANPQMVERKGIDLLELASIAFLIISVMSCLVFGAFVFISYLKEKFASEDQGDDAEGFVDLEAISCEICMNEMREERRTIRCRCGAFMHRGCGRREGVCPKCGREVLI